MIEEVIFSVYVLGLAEDALVLLFFLQEKKNKIPTKATEVIVNFFMLNRQLLLKAVIWNAGFAVILKLELKIQKFFTPPSLFL
jgi:hypothetical protein